MAKLQNNLQKRLDEKGYLAFLRDQGDFAKCSLSEIVKSFGGQTLTYCKNVARTEDLARSNSLSSGFGLGRFPFHTDQASKEVPPRYIILFAPPWRTAGTTVLDPFELPYIDEYVARRALFRSIIGGKSAYTRFMEGNGGNSFFRFNMQTMDPVNEEARTISEILPFHTRKAVKIDWKKCKLLIVDNHRLVHGRTDATPNKREYIRRITIW